MTPKVGRSMDQQDWGVWQDRCIDCWDMLSELRSLHGPRLAKSLSRAFKVEI